MAGVGDSWEGSQESLLVTLAERNSSGDLQCEENTPGNHAGPWVEGYEHQRTRKTLNPNFVLSKRNPRTKRLGEQQSNNSPIWDPSEGKHLSLTPQILCHTYTQEPSISVHWEAPLSSSMRQMHRSKAKHRFLGTLVEELVEGWGPEGDGNSIESNSGN